MTERPLFIRKDGLLSGAKIGEHQLSLWRKKGYIESVKRGMDVFVSRKRDVSAEEISFFLYEPSYLSLEYALSYYGIIPEMVFVKTAVTPKTTRTFTNGFGVFSYRHLQPKLFFGYEIKEATFGKYLLAEPEKALLDFLYLNLGKIHDEQDVEALRLNGEELQKRIDPKKLKRYMSEFGIQKLDKIITIILQTYANL